MIPSSTSVMIRRAVALLCACSTCMAIGLSPAAAGLSPSRLVTIQDEPVPLAGGTLVRTPQTGSVNVSNGKAIIDYSNASEGYIMVKYTGNVGKIKLQITKGKTYTYNLTKTGNYETFPLTAGSGTYSVSVFENVSGTQYALALSGNVNASISNSLSPFLYPSQYVNFNANSATVAKGAELAAGASSDLDIVTKVYAYVVSNISYDTAKANTISAGGMSGYVPSVDSVLASKKGICFDYAAVMTAMLRSQQIPTRLEVGYVSGGIYHAWISTYIKDVGWINNVIYFDGQSWKLMDPTFASSSNQSNEIMKFIGNGSNYTTQYIY